MSRAADALVLTHGAGGNCDAPLLVALAETFCGHGFTVLRCDFPFGKSGALGLHFPASPRDRAGLRNAVEAMQKSMNGKWKGGDGKVFLGGHSYGGRQSTMLCAEEPDLVSGLLLSPIPCIRRASQTASHAASAQASHALPVRSRYARPIRQPSKRCKRPWACVPAKTELMTVEGRGTIWDSKENFRPKNFRSRTVLTFRGFFSRDNYFQPLRQAPASSLKMFSTLCRKNSATDGPTRANYATALADSLRRHLRGEIRFDSASRALYATDGSNYRQVPIWRGCSSSQKDVIATVAVCREHGAPLLARGGGTSLAGQCCNSAVILDFSKYLSNILEIDPARRLARVEPGVVLDTLRAAAEKHHLTFAPDPPSRDRCTMEE